ncbi:MAG: hypothetical protein CSA81_01490 [Acidobacteria bacterium]|nr:MAG: hypothetical protein CSA81_01490 [Acidobacteriota bacterium]
MVLFNYATKELTAKVVYYGPGLCGKTTNLQYIYDTLPESTKGKMLSLATKTDRTLFFDFLPIDLGNIRGMKTKIQLYTVPGQVFYDTTRKLVLKGADGVVFVADSQAPMVDANIDSFDNLITNLREQNQELENLPHVIQLNKRDMKNILSVEEMNEKVNRFNAPSFEAIATEGEGVFETLKGISKLVLKHLTQKYGLEPEKDKSRRMPQKPVPAPPPVLEKEEPELVPPVEIEIPDPTEDSEKLEELVKDQPVKFDPIPEIELDENEEIVFDEDIEETPVNLEKEVSLDEDTPSVPYTIPVTADFSELPLEEDFEDSYKVSSHETPGSDSESSMEDAFENREKLKPLASLDDSEVIELEDLEPMGLEELDEIAELAETSETPVEAEQQSSDNEALAVPVKVTLPASLKGKSLKFQFEITFED